MSISDYMAGTLLAMTGKECVCIATDLIKTEGMVMIATNAKKVHQLTDKLCVGFTGLFTDCTTVLEELIHQKDLYELRENRQLKPKVAASIVSNMLYEHRFGSYFINPLLAGIDPTTSEPYICSMDSIGCISQPKDFVTIGTGEEYMLAVCEGFWREGMSKEELFDATSQAFLSGIGRDASSGYGAIVYTISKDGVDAKTIKTRMD